MILISPERESSGELLSRTTPYNRERAGKLLRLMPGFFVPAEAELSSENVMQWLTMRQPKVVMNLISALQHHKITLQIPDALSVAVPRSTHVPTPAGIPLQVWYTEPRFLQEGIIECFGAFGPYRVTSVERTLVDCFKYRNKLGLSVFLEALRMAAPRLKMWELQHHALTLRQYKQILPSLKSL